MEAFDKYTSQFKKDNNKIILKYNHSYRVRDIAGVLAKKLNLSKENIELATFIGLIHDIGRFEQIDKYDTFTDFISMDHGDYGAHLLFDEGLIAQFGVNKEDYNLIKICVQGHNKYAIVGEYDDRTLTHLKIIRDADKLDIFNIFANLEEMDILFDGKVSKEVEEQFFNNKTVKYETLKTNADSVVGHLSYIYDIAFKETLEYLKKLKYIENLYERVKENKELIKYFEYANNYLKKRGI